MVANLSHRKAHHQLVHNSSHHHVQGGVLGETGLDTTCSQAPGTARPIAIGAHCPAVLNILKTNKWRVLVSLSVIVRLHASHPSVLATHTANWADGFYRPKPSVGCADDCSLWKDARRCSVILKPRIFVDGLRIFLSLIQLLGESH